MPSAPRIAGLLARRLALALLLAGCAAPRCRNTVARRVPSPGGQFDAIVYQRDCGRGEGASTEVAVLPGGADLPDLPTSVLTLAQPENVTATWTGPSELRLDFPARATVVGRMALSPDGVRVRFQPR